MSATLRLHELDLPFTNEIHLARPTHEEVDTLDEADLIHPEQAKQSEQLTARAELALDDLLEADAMSLLRAALRLDPTNSRAAALLEALCDPAPHSGVRIVEVGASLSEADFFLKRGLHDDAKATVRDALRVAPGDGRLLHLLHRLTDG